MAQYDEKVAKALHRIRTSNGFREDGNSEWLGPELHEVEAAHAEIVLAARALITEIQKRDGEGNTIPSHLYSRLGALVGARRF